MDAEDVERFKSLIKDPLLDGFSSIKIARNSLSYEYTGYKYDIRECCNFILSEIPGTQLENFKLLAVAKRLRDGIIPKKQQDMIDQDDEEVLRIMFDSIK